jgi:hypothetical protein
MVLIFYMKRVDGFNLFIYPLYRVSIWNALLSLAETGTTIILTTHYIQV